MTQNGTLAEKDVTGFEKRGIWRAGKWDVAAFALAGLVFWVGLGSYGLVEPSDARYAEIAREMFDSGNWIFPRLLGIYHFHKPPLIYWLTSLGYEVFGVNEWGARAVLGVLGMTLSFVLWRFVRRHVNKASAPWAVIFLATTPALIGASRMLTTDLLLCTLQAIMLTAWYDIWSGKGGRGSLSAFYIACGLSFLTKGPVVLIINAGIIGLFLLSVRAAPRLRTVSWGVGWGVPLAGLLALAWYIAVLSAKPELLGYFLGDQLAARVNGAMGHPHPWYYYLGVFPALGAPWIFPAITGARSLRKHPSTPGLLLVFWAFFPPVLFSLPQTKLPLYVLPSFPAIAALAATVITGNPDATRRVARTLVPLAAVTGALVCLVALGWIPITSGDLEQFRANVGGVLLFPVAGALLISAAWGATQITRKPARAVLAIAVALAIIPGWCFSFGDSLPLRSIRSAQRSIGEKLRAGYTLVEYRSLSSGLPIYSGTLPLLAEIDRDLRFEEESAQPPVLSNDEFHNLWVGEELVLAVTRTKFEEQLLHTAELPPGSENTPSILFRGGGYSVVLNREGTERMRLTTASGPPPNGAPPPKRTPPFRTLRIPVQTER